MRQRIENRIFDEERSLYHLQHGDVISCTFAGPADGESVLKEADDVTLENCSFSLRYPLWHVRGFRLEDSTMDEKPAQPSGMPVTEKSGIPSWVASRPCGSASGFRWSAARWFRRNSGGRAAALP